MPIFNVLVDGYLSVEAENEEKAEEKIQNMAGEDTWSKNEYTPYVDVRGKIEK